MATLLVTAKRGGDNRPLGQEIGANVGAGIKAIMEYSVSVQEERRKFELAPEDTILIERLRRIPALQWSGGHIHFRYDGGRLHVVARPEEAQDAHDGRYEVVLTVCHYHQGEPGAAYGIYGAKLVYVLPTLPDFPSWDDGWLHLAGRHRELGLCGTGVNTEGGKVIKRERAYIQIAPLLRGELFEHSLELHGFLTALAERLWRSRVRRLEVV